MRTGLKKDVIAGFSVFLLALPLCLGIAIASGFPPIAGILSAIVGGLIASFFGGAQLSIKGPAAGLIVIAIGAVTQLGDGDLQLGYERTLAVGAIAALIQIGIGVWRKAVIAEVMPPFVIHGMLAAVGVIIIAQQAYVMMGLMPTSSNPIALLINLPTEILHANPMILAIGILAFIIAVGWPLLKRIAFIPSTLVILLIVIPLSLILNLSEEHSYYFMGHHYLVSSKFLINLPKDILGAITLPDFSIIFSPISLKYILMFALVGSIESLLTVCAIDEMTPQTKASNLNQDLRAVGMGNLISSCIGGLPMISEIVRSKANIDYGATSIRANFIHGLLMLMAVLIFPAIINLIPLTALAALLVFVGLKLASPQQFIHAYRVGRDQLALFLVTFFVTLMTDLLVGVIAGILLKLFIHMTRGYKLNKLLSPSILTREVDDISYIEIDGPLTFLSYLKLKDAIENSYSESKNVVINLNAVTYLDHTVSKKLQSLLREFKNIKISINNNQQLARFYSQLPTDKMY